MLENSINCSLEAQKLLMAYTVGIYAPLAAVYIMVSVLFIRHPNSFHPFFVISFFLMFASYTVSNFILFIRNFIEFFVIDDFTFRIMETIFLFAHDYIPPIVVLALLERLAATIWVNSYESSRHWIIFGIGQILCIIAATIMAISRPQYSDLINDIQFFLSIAIALILLLLLYINQRKTANANARLSLTTRYQLAENIKALRIIVPFIVIDNIIAIMFAVTTHTINVGRGFSEPVCDKWELYIPVFTVLRSIAIILQITMAIIVIYQHEKMSLCSLFRENCCHRTNNIDISSNETGQEELKIKNVLGKNVAEKETGENYFTLLREQWVK